MTDPNKIKKKLMRVVAGFLQKPYLAVFFTLLIAVLCFMPSKMLPESDFDFMDKIHHFVAFAGLGFLWKACSDSYLKIISGLIFFAFFIEIVQFLLPESFNRSFDYYDALSDTIGIFIGLFFFKIYELLIRQFFPGEIS